MLGLKGLGPAYVDLGGGVVSSVRLGGDFAVYDIGATLKPQTLKP